ncbi:MAG TPA: hypothetical protein VMH28_19275 [Candidatus Acidoferrales bacterium]|nr:hypothetical protein [Candidatus Acidoferrales bacterium]
MRFGLACLLLLSALDAQQAQNPSPMVEHTREHPRLPQESPPGRREKLELGPLFLPPGAGDGLAVLVFFHGGTWLPELAAARNGMAAIGVQAGSGSATYARLFENPERFPAMLQEAETRSGIRFGRVLLGGWSAGCGAIRQILRSPAAYQRVDGVLLIDGIHTDYPDGHPGPLESKIGAENLDVWLQFARDAIAGRKRMLITHSEIFPGTFASTTETADYLLKELGVRRVAVLKWGPMGTQQLSEARQGNFLLMGFAGNSAPDHVDQLHSLPEYLKLLP